MANLFKKIKEILQGRIFVALTPKKEKVRRMIKYSFCFGLPLLGAVLGSTFGIIEFNKNNKPQSNIVVELKKDQVNRRVYLLSNDNLTIPLSVSLEKKSTIQEQIMDVYNLLKIDSKLSNEYVKGFLKNDLKMNKFELKDNILLLDFSDNIFNSDFNNTKILEALTMSFVSFDEIDGLEIFVNGTKINQLVSSYIPEVLDLNFGINQDFYYSNSIINKEKQIVFYQRDYDKNYSYIVPLTVYVERESNLNQRFVNATNINQPVSSNLKKISLYNSLELKQNNNEHTYMINSSGLEDENCVNKELYDLVSLSYDLMGYEEKVSFCLDGEVLPVDGIYKEEDSKVSNIIVNEVKI